MNLVYLLLGANVGNTLSNIDTATNLLKRKIGNLIKCSSIYETDAWGNTDQPHFLNQVLLLQTQLAAAECMNGIFSIEKEMGRVRVKKNDPRIIDIDILFFNEEIINTPGLIVPHPQIQNRKFVLMPMNETFPWLLHPILHQTINTLLSACSDPLEVRLLKQA